MRLGYVENLLRLDGELGGERPAITSCDGHGGRVRLTRRELARWVRVLADALEARGVAAGQRVVVVAHNDASAVVAGLAAAALGASLSTASPDMGAFSILARFAPLSPVVLMAHLEGLDPGATEALGARIAEVAAGLPSLVAFVALDDGAPPPGLAVPVLRLRQLCLAPTPDAAPRPWRRFAFDQPLFTLFSSGTTGPPKGISHGAGGTLLEHLKEHRLHGDLRPGERLFFHTSCSWMMWNWQLSALAVGAEIVLFTGPVRAPGTLWGIVSGEQVAVFGASPAYFQMCEDAGYSPRRELPLGSLRAVLSTGSILHDHQFDWVGREVGPVPLQSISGGTDILGCFVLGNPDLPVTRGECQSKSLAMDVQALDADGRAVVGSTGELVCRNPFPSRPLGLLGDGDGGRFHAAYFAQNPGVWTHGDLIEIGPRGGVRMHGRSDGTLNVHGVRVGPAEIYRILQQVPEIAESLAVEQRWPEAPGQSRLLLLLVLKPGASLDGPLRRKIRKELGLRGSPAHVPGLIVAVEALPTTHSGKRSERAARDAANGVDAINADALQNPESLRGIREALAGGSPAASAPPAAGSLASTLAAAWERTLDVTDIGQDENFFELGGSSLLALMLCNDLAEQGLELSPSALAEAPTLARLVAAIERGESSVFSPLVVLKEGQGRPIFLIHGLAGDTLELRELALLLRGGRPVLGVQAQSLDPEAEPQRSVEAMAIEYLDRVCERQPAGPYALVGYSFGGMVAFEMARLLRSRGEEVEFLGLLDTDVHHGCLPPVERASFRALRKVHRALRFVVGQRVEGLRDRVRASIEARLHATVSASSPPPFLTAPMTPSMQRVIEHVWVAFRAYRPGPYAGPVTFFQAEARPPDYCFPLPIWSAASGGRLAVRQVPGDHFTMIKEPNVGALARQLGGLLSPA